MSSSTNGERMAISAFVLVKTFVLRWTTAFTYKPAMSLSVTTHEPAQPATWNIILGDIVE